MSRWAATSKGRDKLSTNEHKCTQIIYIILIYLGIGSGEARDFTMDSSWVFVVFVSSCLAFEFIFW